MLIFNRLQGLRGKTALPGADVITTLFSLSPPAPTASPPGFNPGSIATQPTVTVIQTPTNPGPVAYPPTQPPPNAPVLPWSPTADVPTLTVLPPAPRKAWVPWAIGGGVVAAIGAALAVAFANR